jgi:hypothetical protein
LLAESLTCENVSRRNWYIHVSRPENLEVLARKNFGVDEDLNQGRLGQNPMERVSIGGWRNLERGLRNSVWLKFRFAPLRTGPSLRSSQQTVIVFFYKGRTRSGCSAAGTAEHPSPVHQNIHCLACYNYVFFQKDYCQSALSFL